MPCCGVDGAAIMPMESIETTLSEVRASLLASDGQAFVRLVGDAGLQTVWHVDIVAGAPADPPGWKPQVWRYAEASFVAEQVSRASLAEALSSESTRTLCLSDFKVSIPPLQEHGRWERRPSRTRHDLAQLPWPARGFDLFSPKWAAPSQQGRRFLIGDDCPSFPSFEAAFRAFFYGDFASLAGHGGPSMLGQVRLVDDQGWFERVRVTPTSLEIVLGGTGLEGTRVELNGETWRASAPVSDDVKVSLPLPEGLPRGAWLYLSRDRDWLDYRAIGEAIGQGDLARTGVEVEVPEDPESVIDALLASGEGSTIEFKQQLPENSVESKRKIFKTVAAFANGQGGNLVFGVESDEATVCGVEVSDLVKERDRLSQLATDLVTPSPVVGVRAYDVAGKTVLVLSVQRGSAPPYALNIGGKIEFYVRRDATTRPARPEDMRASVLASEPLPDQTGQWG